MEKLKDRTGETKQNKWGSIMTILKYNNAFNMIVKFENGYTTNTTYQHFKSGSIKTPYDKVVYDVGFVGEGNYKVTENNRPTIQYDYWHSMLQRCYDKKFVKRQKTYVDCIVCDEWLNFQKFAQWFDNNYYEIKEGRMSLDKDILYKHNKIYSPKTCVFVPSRINVLFTKSNASRGNCVIGVRYKKDCDKFEARCSTFKNNTYLGLYNSEKEAYYVYKHFKEQYIKQIAEEYKDDIPKELYDALYKYEVEIDD